MKINPKKTQPPLSRDEVIDMLRAAKQNSEHADFTDRTVTGPLDRLNLRSTVFRRATLQKVDFTEADVTEAVFRDADLREADLSLATGLIPEQLAGADLTRCRLPDDVKSFPQLENVKEISKNAGALFLSMILGCVFVLITSYSTRDLQLLANTGTAQLPVLNVGVPTLLFFKVAPIVLTILFITVHFYLQRLWSLIGSLPAFFPDGTRLEMKTYPWLLNDLVQTAFPRLQPPGWRRYFVRSRLLAIVAYACVPATVLAVWFRCLPKHDQFLNTWQAIIFLVLCVVTPTIKATQWREMTGQNPKATLQVAYFSFAGLIGLWPIWVDREILCKLPLSPKVAQREMMASLSLIDDENPVHPQAKNENEFPGRLSELIQLEEDKSSDALQRDPYFIASVKQASQQYEELQKSFQKDILSSGLDWPLLFTGFGNLTEDLSRRPDKWEDILPPQLSPSDKERNQLAAGNRGEYTQRVDDLVRKFRLEVTRLANNVPRATFVQVGGQAIPNLRFLQAPNSFLVNSDFRGADLTGADFWFADLRDTLWSDNSKQDAGLSDEPRWVNLSFATLANGNLEASDLSQARFIGANLSGTDLCGADLTESVLTGAEIYNAKLTGATLTAAAMRGADLSSAKLEASDLSHAILTNADLTVAILDGADLTSAKLGNANLSGASLVGVAFDLADLTDAEFSHANVAGASFAGADISAANLDCVRLQDADLDGATFGDAPSAWPKGWEMTSKGVFRTDKNGRELRYRIVPVPKQLGKWRLKLAE